MWIDLINDIVLYSFFFSGAVLLLAGIRYLRSLWRDRQRENPPVWRTPRMERRDVFHQSITDLQKYWGEYYP